MAQRANVTSIDAVDDFAAALLAFKQEATGVLEGLEQQIERAVQWIQQDQRQYWKHELRRSEQQLQEAKINLQRCLTFKRIGDHRPSCIEEKRAVERAKRRHQLCREKNELVRRWSLSISRAVFEYKAGVGELGQWLETDAARSVGLLKRIAQTLEEYVAAQSSPEAAKALERLPWTDEGERRQHQRLGPEEEEEAEERAEQDEGEREEAVVEEDSPQQPERSAEAAEANDGDDGSRGQEDGSEDGVSS